MKSEIRIKQAIEMAENNDGYHRGMTYEQGVVEALLWILGEISDDEFSF